MTRAREEPGFAGREQPVQGPGAASGRSPSVMVVECKHTSGLPGRAAEADSWAHTWVTNSAGGAVTLGAAVARGKSQELGKMKARDKAPGAGKEGLGARHPQALPCPAYSGGARLNPQASVSPSGNGA